MSLYNEYCDAVHKNLGSRIGGGLASYDVVIRAHRLCKLYEIDAPKIIIANESKLLIQAMAVNKYAKSMCEIAM